LYFGDHVADINDFIYQTGGNIGVVCVKKLNHKYRKELCRLAMQDYRGLQCKEYSLQFAKLSRFGQDLSQTLGI
jgi:hypothetical protein